MSASRAAAATTAGGPVATSAASATASLPEGMRAVNDVDLKDGGGDDGRRACNDVDRQRHSAFPVGGEGRRRHRPHGRRRQLRQEGLRRRRRPAPWCLFRRGCRPSKTWASRAVAATTAGGLATTSAASSMEPLPEGARAVDDVDLTGGGGDHGKRACHEVGRKRHGASPVGDEGRRRREPQVGGGYDARRACDDVGRQRHGVSPGEGKGRR